MGDFTQEAIDVYEDIKENGVEIAIKRKRSRAHNPIIGVEVYAEAQLDGSIDDLVTSLNIKDPSQAFYDSGVIWIDNEEIAYDSITGNILNSLVRGNGGTNKATHNDNVSIYLVSQDAEYPTYALITNYLLKHIDGTLIKQGDKRLIIPAYNLAIYPESGDIITIDSNNWLIENVETVKPDAIGILHKVQVRGV